MTLEEKIVEWSRERPGWQRAILRRIADGEVLTEEDYDELANRLVEGEPFEEVAFGLAHFPQTQLASLPVQLVSISHPEHVNAIDSEQPLAASPTGLTLVYGDNGSGKSGYARILKRIASARHNEDVLSDVYRDTAAAEPTAQLTVTVGEDTKTLSWPHGELPELRRMRFYDAECGKAYINTECDFPFQPSPLALLEGLIEACLAVRSRIDGKLNANNLKAKPLPVIDDACKDSEPGRFLAELSGRSSIATLDALISRFDANRLQKLERRKHDFQRGDTQRETGWLLSSAKQLESLATHIEELDRALGDAAIQAFAEKRDALCRAENAARLAAGSFNFESEPLPGGSTQHWKALWESARQYSQQHAYVDQSFPVTGGDARCVLCQQRLEPEASERLSRFEQFVKGDTELKVTAARSDYSTLVSDLKSLRCSTESVEASIADLTPDYAPLAEEAKTLVEDFEAARVALLRVDGPHVDQAKPRLDATGLAARLRAASKGARNTAASLATPGGAERRLATVTKERDELELLRKMKSQRAEIGAEIERLKERDVLSTIRSDAATTGISKQVSLLSKNSITEVVRDRFARECHDLKLERITLDARARKGSLYHKPKLIGLKQTVSVPRVFSEGEKTALGLAAFFSEAELDESRSSVILDDPVSSLDHIRRRQVARRLIAFARSRQVIVFTHDAALVADLKLEAGGRVKLREMSVCRSWSGDNKPGKCEETLPWKIQDVPQRIDYLRNRLARIRKESPGWDATTYGNEVALWAGHVSETWERIFSQEIVGQILGDGGTEVRILKVRLLVHFSGDDFKEFDASYSRVSQWAPRHDKSVTMNYVPPEVTDLEKELEIVDQWYKKIKRYKNKEVA